MSLRRLLAALGLGLALLVAGPAPAVDALEATVSAEATPAAGQATVRRRRSPLLGLLRVPPRRHRRPRPPHVVRLRPAAGHEAPRRAPPPLLI